VRDVYKEKRCKWAFLTTGSYVFGSNSNICNDNLSLRIKYKKTDVSDCEVNYIKRKEGENEKDFEFSEKFWRASIR